MKSLKVLAIEAMGGAKNQNLRWVMLTKNDLNTLVWKPAPKKPMYLGNARKLANKLKLIKSLYSARWFGEGTRNKPYFYTVNELGIFTYYPRAQTLRVAMYGKNTTTYTNVDPAILQGSKRTHR